MPNNDANASLADIKQHLLFDIAFQVICYTSNFSQRIARLFPPLIKIYLCRIGDFIFF